MSCVTRHVGSMVRTEGFARRHMQKTHVWGGRQSLGFHELADLLSEIAMCGVAIEIWASVNLTFLSDLLGETAMFGF